MSESADGIVDYKQSYFECLKERDVARRDYEVMYKLLQGAEADIERMTKEIAYLDSKIESATKCHPNAIQTLLFEAKHRVHFDA